MRARLDLGVNSTSVPFWYHCVMAMNLRLSEEDDALLEMLAAHEQISKQDAARRAIRERASRVARTAAVEDSGQRMLVKWRDVIDDLGSA